MEPPELPNPYAPPAAAMEPAAGHAGEQEAPLADHAARLGAALLDGLVSWVPFILGTMVGGGLYASKMSVMHGPGSHVPPDQVFEQMGTLFIAIGIGMLGSLSVGIFQCYRIATTGQSLAKGWLSIKIVNVDGSPLGFGAGVGMRGILPWLITCVPYLGMLFWLVDVVFIFREDRRCLHDLMAGTKVVAVLRD
jgi:uncharacterized RDD family membrane protein YckC